MSLSRGFAEVGIVLIMFAIGFEERVDHFLDSVKRSWGIAFFGALAPFLTAYSLTWWFWQDFAIALMCGLAMTATAVSLTMVALRSEGLGQSIVALRIMTSAVIDDIASLALVAILIPLAVGGDAPSLLEAAVLIVKVIAFFAAVVLLSVFVLPHSSGPRWLRGLNIRTLLAFEQGEYATLIVMLMAVVIGLLAHVFGFHPAVGAYMAGLILREEYFHFGEQPEKTYPEVARLINNVAFAWMGPVFFVLLGTHLQLDVQRILALLPEVMSLTLCLFIAQVGSAALAARYTSGLNLSESMMVGFGMLGRAELAFVVLDIAFVQHAILTADAFYVLMMTAFCLNVAVPVCIRLWKPYFYSSAVEIG